MYLRVCSYLNKKHTVEFREFFYVGYDGQNNFLEPKVCRGVWVTNLGLLSSGGLRPVNGTPLECTLAIGNGIIDIQ